MTQGCELIESQLLALLTPPATGEIELLHEALRISFFPQNQIPNEPDYHLGIGVENAGYSTRLEISGDSAGFNPPKARERHADTPSTR